MPFFFIILLVVWCHSGILVQGFVVDLRKTNPGSIIRSTTTVTTATTSTIARNGSSKLTMLFVKRSKWDDLVDEDDDEVNEESSSLALPKIPNDMRHIERNIDRQYNTFQAIVSMGDPSLINDIYVRNPNTSNDEDNDDCDTFWFTGKVARVSDISVEEAIIRQWGLIVEHIRSMRPDQFPSKSDIEIWFGPGDCEIDVVYNNPAVKFTKVNIKRILNEERLVDTDINKRIKLPMVGYQGESFGRGFEAFRTWRNIHDGTPKYPEIIRDAPLDKETEEAIEKASTATELQEALMNRNNFDTSTPIRKQSQAKTIANELQQQQQQGDKFHVDEEVLLHNNNDDDNDDDNYYQPSTSTLIDTTIEEYRNSLDKNRNQMDEYIKQRKDQIESDVSDTSWEWLKE